MEVPKAPWWIGLPASVGFGVMGAVAATFLPIWVQAGLFALGGIAVLWSLAAGAWHFELIGRKGRRARSEDRVTFAEIVRRAALETEWALDYEPCPYGWFRDLQRQVLDPFSTNQLEATGLYSRRDSSDATAITTIPFDFWAEAKFSVEYALASHQDVLVFDSGIPCSAVAEEITIRAIDLDRIWPKARKRNGRTPSIRALVLEWKIEHEKTLPDGLQWEKYVNNQRQWTRMEKRRRPARNRFEVSQANAVFVELLRELAERVRYACEVKKEGGTRLDIWRAKVSEASQGIYDEDLKAIALESLSHTQVASIRHARRRVSDFNKNTVHLSRNEDRNSDYVANLFLQRAEETKKALTTAVQSLQN